MKVGYLMLLVAVVALVVGCGPPVPQAQGAAKTNAEVSNAAPVVTGKAKNEFVDDLRRKLDLSDQKISELNRKFDSLSEDAKTEGKKAIESWRVQRGQLAQKLDEVKRSGQESGQDIKAGCESAVAELEKAFEKLKSRFQN